MGKGVAEGSGAKFEVTEGRSTERRKERGWGGGSGY